MAGFEKKAQVITAEKQRPKLTVQHFMALVQHKPHASMLEVEGKQDGFFYRLVKNNPARIRYWEKFGFEVVTNPDDAKMLDTGQPDGRRITGGLVLMRQPEQYHLMLKEALRKKADTSRRSPVERFKGKAKDMGVEVVDKMREMTGPLDAPLPDIDDDWKEFEK